MKENRRSLRINHRTGINVTFLSGETMKAYTRDMSDGGLLIECPNHPILKEGDLAEVIVLGIEGAVPRAVKIVRLDSKGQFAVQFTIS